MPPDKAIRLTALDALKLSDTGYGFTIELLIRAHAQGLKIVEVDVSCLPRAAGLSKVSGTVGGSIKVASKIVYTIGRHALLKAVVARAWSANRPALIPLAAIAPDDVAMINADND